MRRAVKLDSGDEDEPLAIIIWDWQMDRKSAKYCARAAEFSLAESRSTRPVSPSRQLYTQY